MDQSVLDRAVTLATRCAMYGHPVARIQWIPPSTPAQDPGGVFAIHYAPQYSGSQKPCWEE